MLFCAAESVTFPAIRSLCSTCSFHLLSSFLFSSTLLSSSLFLLSPLVLFPFTSSLLPSPLLSCPLLPPLFLSSSDFCFSRLLHIHSFHLLTSFHAFSSSPLLFSFPLAPVHLLFPVLFLSSLLPSHLLPCSPLYSPLSRLLYFNLFLFHLLSYFHFFTPLLSSFCPLSFILLLCSPHFSHFVSSSSSSPLLSSPLLSSSLFNAAKNQGQSK